MDIHGIWGIVAFWYKTICFGQHRRSKVRFAQSFRSLTYNLSSTLLSSDSAKIHGQERSMITLGRAAIILMFNLMLLTGCENSGKRDFSPIPIADEYIRDTRPDLIQKYPIRSLDENKGFWLVYYLPRPGDNDFDPSRLGRNGFIVGVDKQTGQADFAGFQQ